MVPRLIRVFRATRMVLRHAMRIPVFCRFAHHRDVRHISRQREAAGGGGGGAVMRRDFPVYQVEELRSENAVALLSVRR